MDVSRESTEPSELCVFRCAILLYLGTVAVGEVDVWTSLLVRRATLFTTLIVYSVHKSHLVVKSAYIIASQCNLEAGRSIERNHLVLYADVWRRTNEAAD